MTRIYRKIDIHAPVERVYRYIENPYNLISWMRNFVIVENVRGMGEGSQYSWSWNMAGVPLRGEFTNIEDVPNEQIVLKSRGDIESLWSFRFERHDNVTTLDLDIDYRVPIPANGKVTEQDLFKLNEHDTDVALRNLKERLELES
jgi:uncharacterized membrane protein